MAKKSFLTFFIIFIALFTNFVPTEATENEEVIYQIPDEEPDIDSEQIVDQAKQDNNAESSAVQNLILPSLKSDNFLIYYIALATLLAGGGIFVLLNRRKKTKPS